MKSFTCKTLQHHLMYDLDLEVLSMEKKSSPNERPSIEISQNWKGSLNQLSILIANTYLYLLQPSTQLHPRLTILSLFTARPWLTHFLGPKLSWSSGLSIFYIDGQGEGVFLPKIYDFLQLRFGRGNIYIDFNTIIMIQFANNCSKKVSQNMMWRDNKVFGEKIP